MASYDELRASDFVDMPEAPFEEWKAEVNKAKRNVWIFMGVIVVVELLLLIFAGALVVPGALLILLGVWTINRKHREMAKELGIDKASINEARARREIAK